MSEQNTAPVQPPQFDGPPSAGESVPGGAVPQKSGAAIKKILGIVVVVLVGLGVFLLRNMLNQDDTADAKAGDCIASLKAPKEGETTNAAGAEVVDCTSSEAKFTVIGRVDNQTEAQFNADPELKICTDAGHKDSEIMLWSKKGGSGYVLCLIEKK